MSIGGARLASWSSADRWLPVCLLAAVLALSGLLAVEGPAMLRTRAAESVEAEQTVIAQQGAARIGAALEHVAHWLANPRRRATSRIEEASGPEDLRRALGAMSREGLPDGTLLFIHDAGGRVLAADHDALGPMAEEFEHHHHAPRTGAWSAGADVCPECLSDLHQISVASPLGHGRFLAANLDAAKLARQSLESLLAGPGQSAWLAGPDGTVILRGGAGAAQVAGPEWTRASAELTAPAARWSVHVAVSRAIAGQRVARGATELLAGAGLIGLLAVLAGLLVLRDLRRRQREELRRSAALAHQDKLVTLGALTAGIGHEVRNIVTAVVGNIAFARTSATTAPDVAQALADAEESAGRLHALSRDLTTFGRRDERAPAPRPLRLAIEEALRLALPALKHGLRVETEYRAEPVVSQLGGQIAQVVLNLVRNAAQAMDGAAGQVRIQVSTSGDRARLVVEDDGPGLAPEARDHLFEPFFTTKPAGIGTGLGLAVCAEIVRRHGGDISAANRDEGGARFVVELPCVPPQQGAS